MGKFYGPIGFITQTETSPGIWEDDIVERSYRGDILKDYRRWQPKETKNDDLVISNKVSIVADQYAYENLSTIRYIEWQNIRWKVTEVEIQRPRLILTLGAVYNG